MAGDLTIVWAKLDRAKAHAETFDHCFTGFLKRQPYSINIQRDADPPWCVHCRWQVKEAPPTDLALILGDMLTNLRATLDYLVWQLVRAAHNTPTDRNAFPCCKRSGDWPSVRGDRLKGVEDRWADEIRDLQPYNRTSDIERHMLAVLDGLNNINKHRTLPPMVMTVPEWQFTLGGDIGGRNISFDQWLDRPIEEDVEFARYCFDPPLDKTNLGIDTDPAFRIAFRDGLNHSDGWTYTNADLIEYVEEVVRIFEPAFAS